MPHSQTRQDNLEAMQRAEEATVLLGLINSYVNTAVLGITSNLVGHYRGGKVEHDALLGGIAEISALMGLVDHLQSTQRTGERAAEKEFSNGQEAEPVSAPVKGASIGTRGAEFRRSQPT